MVDKKKIYCLILMLMLGSNTLALTTRFMNTAGDGDWFTETNWDPQYPTASDDAYINGGRTANIDANGAVANNLYFGLSGSSGHLAISIGGTLTVNDKLRIGADPATVVNTMTMTGGDVTANSLQLGNNLLCTGSFTMNGSDANLSTVASIAVGISGTGDIQMVDGTLSTDGQFVFGYNSTSTGTMTMSGGTIIASTFELGYNGEGTVTMTGGVINTDYLDVGRFDTGTGHLQLDGGVINVSTNFRMRLRTSTGTVDITLGEIIIDGDQTAAVTNYKNDGWLTAYGESDNVLIDYDNINPGKTTVKSSIVCPSVDLNNDCVIDFEDLAILASQWLQGPTTNN